MKTAKHQRRRKGICAYCGSHGPITNDHVPPAALFSDPKPLNLITVKACDRCHKQWSKDDEYFRIRLCLNDQARGHPDVNGNLPSIFSGLNRADFAGLKQDLLADWRTVDVKTPAGIYLGRRTAFEVDMPRICRVVERTVRGLYYRERKLCLPKDYDVRVITNELLMEQDADVREEILATVIRPLATIPPKVIGRHAFSYRVHFTNRPTVSVWGLVFYNSVQFVAATGPELLKKDGDHK